MFNHLFQTAVRSPIIGIFTIAYFITSAITTFDIRLIQGVKNGTLPPDEPMLPKWVNVIFWLDWIIFICLFLLNWKFALLVIVVRFIFKVLPVLETIGNVLMFPFKKK